VQVLVICPTQELCMQVLRAARSLLPANRHRVQPLVGKPELLLYVVPLVHACFRRVASS
jgi:superfamily II DNA/RNA helicase